MNTTEQMVPVNVPVGWKAVRYARIPRGAPQTKYLNLSGQMTAWGVMEPSDYFYVILEPDPSYIDTTTEEYRVEVYRQWLRGKVVEVLETSLRWSPRTGGLWWQWDSNIYRVQPEGTDELGPYYLDGEKKVYVPK